MKRLLLWFLPVVCVLCLFSCQETTRSSEPTEKKLSLFYPSGQMKVHKKVETKINLDYLYYDSRDLFCKTPFGAVEQGQEIRLRFACKKNDVTAIEVELQTKQIYDTFAKSVKYKKFKKIPMEKAFSTNGYDVWEAKFALDQIGVYGYSFNLTKSEDDKITYADNANTVNVPGVMIKGTGGIGQVTPYGKYKNPYNLSVYVKNLTMPAWTDNMVIYYIFPERFKNGNKANDPVVGKTKYYGNKDIEVHKNWSDPKPWVPGNNDGNETDDGEYCNDFYGGDIDGIIQKLDYIKSLGVNVIYLNPVFRAPSNHKYDCADYLSIDPHFGDMKTFQKLCAEAKKRGIHIILDTSLNHCGSDSVYMDRYGKYPTLGAFENQKITPESPYYDWFEFNPKATDPKQMFNSWLGIDSLANLKESDSYKKFAYRDKDSVTKFWLRQGAGGWRMDVAPWVSDDFWREWHSELKKDFPDAFTVAEVWFDASKYLLGDMFDCTMNYIFRQSLLDYAKGGKATKTVEALELMRENYPEPVFYRLMNLMSTHDLPRTLWEVGYKEIGQKNYEDVYKKKFLLTLAFQFTYPGAPTIYYGDEVGMTGGFDPFNRGPYPWKEDGGTPPDESIISIMQQLSRIRQDHPVFVGGKVRMIYSDKNIILFERWNDKERAVVVFSNAKEDSQFVLTGITEGTYVNLEDGSETAMKNGMSLTIPAYSYRIWLKKAS